MFSRDIEKKLISFSKFPVVAILGPRQSGKTTLAQEIFPNHKYTSFERPDTRNLAQQDPEKFLRVNENKYGIIIDEFQYVPHILSYIQLAVDEQKRSGYFILTGSQNFLMNEAITQSLAGRIGILTLQTLSLHELKQNKILSTTAQETIYNGGYPRLYNEHIPPSELYPSYIQTYIEKDVRQLINVGDIASFQRFIKLCAGRVGQLLNLAEIAGVCGISVTTAQRWLSVLEASYIVFLLQPYFKNFNKRLTKSPKLYFYDTGLACAFLDIESAQALTLSPFYGPLFENLIIADIYKQYLNKGQRPPVYFWRDLNGRIEVDCIIEAASSLYPIEIKSGETIVSDFFTGLKNWGELTHIAPEQRYVVYGGDLVQERSAAHIVGWKSAGTLVDRIKKK